MHGAGDRHYITCSCYRRQAFLGSARRRDLFLTILEEIRLKYDFVIWGHVVMPEHFHLLITEPKVGRLSLMMQILKQRVSRRRRKKKKPANQMTLWENQPARAFWQRRYYDFIVFRERKHVEKLRYMHRNPVKRGLVAAPEQWRWSSFRHYSLGETHRLNNTEQLIETGEAAMKATGKPLKVGTTNPNVKVSGPAQRNPNLDIQPVKKP
jgi:putative transposase